MSTGGPPSEVAPDRVRALQSVLLIEDDPGDVLMVREVFEEHGWAGQLAVVGDGIEAVDYMRQSGAYSDVPRPDMILLDLNLPRMSGREVLHYIKSDAGLGHIPVIVLTTSAAEEDVIRAYSSHANAYVTKPMDWAAFTGAVRGIGHFYAEVARLPAVVDEAS
jgi:CheY-like chemotaxis protein